MPVGFDSIRAGASGSADAYEIDYACRFNDDDNASLSRTPSASNRDTWSFSAWVKTCNLPITDNFLFQAGPNGDNQTNIRFENDFLMRYLHQDGTATTDDVQTLQVFRDPSAWYHILIAVDTTDGTASNRIRIYINGVEVTSWTTANYPAQNVDTDVNANVIHHICGDATGGKTFDCYLADTVFIDGLQLDPTSFGETNADTGQWVPIDPSGLTFGSNGFHLDFADSSDLGNDVSGNNNDWTSSGLATNDQVTDTPTNNHCTWNSVYAPQSGVTLSEGNTGFSNSAGSQDKVQGTFLPASGKWYWEIKWESGSAHGQIGIMQNDQSSDKEMGDTNSPGTGASLGYRSYDGKTYKDRTLATYGDTWTTGDIIGVAWDADNEKVYMSKNGTWQNSGDPAAETNPAYSSLSTASIDGGGWGPAACNEGSTLYIARFAEAEWSYSAPTDFLALNTSNLADPAIPDPSAHFQATLYTGNATAGRAITQDGNSTFGPDLVWIKNRDQADEWKVLDTTRGATKEMNLDSTADESTDANGLTAFSATDGFTLGTGAGGYNDNAEDFVAYQWEKGVTPGFDMVLYSGNTTNRTISHGLGVVPDIIIVKERTDDLGPWIMYHSSNTSAPETDVLEMNVTGATVDAANAWNDTAPTSSVFTVGTNGDMNDTGDTYIAYLFAAVEGFSAFGSYVGNSSSDGPMINMGFKPKLWITKPSGVADNWMAFDTERNPNNDGLNKYLFLDTPGAEGVVSNRVFDLLSNGVKIRTSHGSSNQSGVTYIYMAWAETPFKTATAR